MSAVKKPISALAGVVAMLLAGLFLAAVSAGAYPPDTPPTLSVSDTSPPQGRPSASPARSYQPDESVEVDVHATAVTVEPR